jgi:AcrR family transcriptional regulator
MSVRSRATRSARARATRERIVAAAAELFVRDGYLDTTMAALAAAAGVAVQTLYLSFGSKAAVLEAVLAADPPDPPRTPELPDGPAVLAAHVAATAAAVERHHPLDAVLRAAAADPEPAALLAARRAAALQAHAAVVDRLAELPGFTTEISLQRATDLLAVLLSPETYEQLVVRQGWTAPDWAEWVTRHAAADLFADLA